MKTIFILGFSKYYYIMFWHFKNIQVCIHLFTFHKPASISPILNIWVNMKWILKTWNMWWGGLGKKVAEITMLCNSCIASWKNDGKVEISAFFLRRKKILFPGQMQKGNSIFFMYTENILQTIHIDAVEIWYLKVSTIMNLQHK